MNEAQVREQSERLFDMITSDDADMHKTAAQELSDYTRIRNREGSFVGKIMDATPFDRSRLVPQLHTDQPVMLFEFEPDSPFAAPVDYGTTPSDFIPRGRRYPLVFQLMQTRKSVMDVLELQTYEQDLRQILADNKTKDLIALRDWKFIETCRRIIGSAPGTVLPWVGQAMYRNLGSALTHSALQRAKNTLRDTQFHIEPTKMLMYHTRRADFDTFAVEEFQGTDKAVDIAFRGWTEKEYSNLQIMFTIKKKLVPYADTFMFGPQEYLGRYVQWVEPTMSVKKEDMTVQFSLYEVYGITLAHPGALCINQFL